MHDLAALASPSSRLCQRFLILMKSNLSIIFCVLFMKSLPISSLQRFSPTFSSRNFIVYTIKYRYELYQINFVYGVRCGQDSFFFSYRYLVFSAPLDEVNMFLYFFILFLFFFYKFIYLWLCWVFVSVRGLSPVAASGGHSSSRCAGLSPSRPPPVAASPIAEHRLQMRRLSSCGSRA